MSTYRGFRSFLFPRRINCYFDCSSGLTYIAVLAALSLAAPRVALAQEMENAAAANIPMESGIVQTKKPPAEKRRVDGEIAITTMIPDGDYRMFSATVRCNAWPTGVEYDRHSWGHLLKSQVDYVVEVIPIMILSQPAVSDFWGNAKSPNQELVPGMAVSPFGFRFLWRSTRAIRPYMTGKLGAAVFAKKAFSQKASYVNFNIQVDAGLLFRLSDRVDLRVDPFVFFHVSNGYLAASNPGMDELATRFGVNYHLGKRERDR